MKAYRLLGLVIALIGATNQSDLFAADSAGLAPANQWPSFRGGPTMAGVSAGVLPDSLELLWSVKLKEQIEATAAISDNVVYVATLAGKIKALQLRDGKEIWTYADPEENGVHSSPCIAKDRVIFGNDAGAVLAVDRKTGGLAWKYNTDDKVISSPNYVHGKIVVGSYDSALHCIDPDTGKGLWKLAVAGPVHGSPSLAGDAVVIVGCDGFARLVALDGKEKGALELGGNIASTPAVFGNQVFVGTLNFEVISVDFTLMKRAWTYENETRRFPFHASPAVVDDVVIVAGHDKTVQALDQKTGKSRWSFRTRGKIESSPVVVGGRVFFGSHDGSVYALNLKDGKKVWDYVLGGEVIASPAIASGRLVIANNDGVVFCFGKHD